MVKAKKLALISTLLGLALIIFVIEAQIPPIAPIPGIKLGLANVINLIALYMLGRKESFIILVLRIVIGSIFAGSMTGFIYSISGGLLSFLTMSVMLLCVRENKMWITSAFGAIGHNIGQIAAAVFITGTPQVMWYLPILIISAVITGFFTGITAQTVVLRLCKTRIVRTFLDDWKLRSK